MTYTPVAPIVTARLSQYDDAHTLSRAVETGAYSALRRALEQTPEDVHETVKAAVLQGRGGAGFPAGTKWGLMPPKFPRWLVVNGDESEPGTYKDRILMERDPHQVIEGALITAYAIRASQAFIYVRGEMALAQERMAQALTDAYAEGYAGRNILGSDWSMDVTLTWGAGAYIVGDETALLESLSGRRGMPRPKPPYFPAAIGLYDQPTIVNNIETMSNIPWIVLNGGEAFAAIGAEKTHGTRMFALSGHVKKPGVYEVGSGTLTFRDLFYDERLGGGIRDDRRLKAFIPGGGSAPWFFEEHLDLALDPTVVGPAGSMLGSGAIVVMDETTDMVRAAYRLVRFFAHESCGKCTPCREGASWMQTIYERILGGQGRVEDLALLEDIGNGISPGPYPGAGPRPGDAPVPFPPRQTTICVLGPSAVAPVTSSLRRFPEEYMAYIERAAAPVPS
ncbi:MAG TPA: NADH-ubiquinone oxidoreductase-F iron-sulfur binding region domain-containing protein [Acidimicrobiales bacterium]|nr:NADH-ubiquinone oxidoreductase-F iron-sulfur binding region domain-containing protein [Acidimicrobiales bacterium]